MVRVSVLHNVDFGVVHHDDAGEGDEPPSNGEPDEPPSSVADDGELARAEIIDVARTFARVLNNRAGIHATAVPVASLRDVTAHLEARRPHLVVNLVESLRASAAWEPLVAAALERAGVAFTGSESAALRLCLDKFTCAETLRRAGVPTPRSFLCADAGRLPRGVRYPCIVKPNREDGSIGITAASVCRDEASLRERVAAVVATHRQPALVQDFVGTREINVAVLGFPSLRTLPISEIAFRHRDGAPAIVTYDSKWVEGSDDWEHTPVERAALSIPLERRIEHAVRRGVSALGLRDYARFDIRLGDADEFWIIDVNPNCGMAPDAGFASSAARAGLDYEALATQLVLQAASRLSEPTERHVEWHRRARVRRPRTPSPMAAVVA
ncbi:MAG: ATP-grasp domain-containing protein [Myxococcales bacterium]|nr:ATP-grasp domain-containing protein [Myxococcales bacterium]